MIYIVSDFNPYARFYRGLYDVCMQMLFFAALSGTMPLYICTPDDRYRRWDSSIEEWVQADDRSNDELKEHLDADLREECWEGARFWAACCVGLVVLFFLITGPLFAAFRIRQYNAHHSVRHKRPFGIKNSLVALFVGHPDPPPKTKAQIREHEREYEERLLREPFSVLYAMNEEHTWCAQKRFPYADVHFSATNRFFLSSINQGGGTFQWIAYAKYWWQLSTQPAIGEARDMIGSRCCSFCSLFLELRKTWCNHMLIEARIYLVSLFTCF